MDGPIPRRAGLASAGVLAIALAAIAPPGCLGPVGTTATSALQQAGQSRDPNVRLLAYQQLGSARVYDDDGQKVEAAKLLVARLDDKDEPPASRAVICRSLGELRRPEGRTALAHALDDPEAIVRAEACRGLGRIGRAEDAPALARIMSADTSLDCRVAAIEALGALRSPDPRIAEALVEGMEHTDPAIRFASLQALRTSSGKDLGVDAKAWRHYASALSGPKEAPTRR